MAHPGLTGIDQEIARFASSGLTAIEARHSALLEEIRGDPPGEPETTRDVRELRALEAAQRRLDEGTDN